MATSNKFGLLKWFVILLVLACIGAGVWYWRQPGNDMPDYRTATVERGGIVQVVTATGQLNPVVNVQVGSQISGIITNLSVDYNSSVKQGQVIAQLDPGTYSAVVHQGEGDLANAEAALELAELNAKRSTDLLAANLIPAADNDKAQADLHQAQAQVKIKQAALERSKVDLARCTIYAPVDGVVISRNVDVGQTVAASLSAPTLYVIANDLTRMQIDANVSEADVGGVEVGQNVNFLVDAFPYRTFHGKVIQIRNSPITVQNVVSYDTVIEVYNEDLKLKPGMTANVSIITAEKENVLKVPNAALRFRPPDLAQNKGVTNSVPLNSNAPAMASAQGGERRRGGSERSKGTRPLTRTVYLLSATNNVEIPQPKAAQVKTGISDGLFTEIVEGLREEDQVVIGVNMDVKSAATAPASNPFGGGPRRF